MRKIAFGFVAVLFATAASVFAISVDEDELRSVDQTIVFENYTGPHSVVNTLEQIRAIGTGLGQAIAANANTAGTTGNGQKYSVIHAIDPSTKEKLDADILILGADAEVDHIRNLRHIIAGYLSAAYGYSSADAQTIATFVTVYNAVYRKNLDIFKSKYKEIVTNNLTAEKAGLSTKYTEWPGNSQIVIPVSDVSGGLSAVDTSVISDKEVISSMQEDDDKNIDARKEMVDIKEREAEQATEKAQEAQKEATQAQKNADEEKAKLEEKKEETRQAEEKAEEAQKKADENPDDEQAQEEAKQAQEEAEQAREEEAKQEEKAEEAQKDADEAKQTASDQQAVADKKQSEAQEERKSISQDQQAVAEKETANENAATVYGLNLANTSSLNSSIVKVNASNGSVVQESELDVIRGRAMYETSDGFIAIAGENKGNSAVKLVIIDPNSLEITKESEEVLSDNSVLVQDGSEYLVVIKDKIMHNVAKYDANLNLIKKSPVPVSPNSPIVKTSAGYMVTDVAGQPLLLDLNELTITIKQAVDAVSGTVQNIGDNAR